MTRQRGRLLLGALLAAALLAGFFRGIGWSALGEALRTARLLPLLGLVVVTVGVYSLRAWRWGDLLAPLGRVAYPDLFSATWSASPPRCSSRGRASCCGRGSCRAATRSRSSPDSRRSSSSGSSR